MSSPPRCLVTGASGYIGGRLVPELVAAGYGVRCMARDPGKLNGRPWSGDVEVAVADATDRTAVRRALEGVDVAYYLIHSLGAGASFEQRDRDAAGIFADAAMSAGVKRIVNLGGIVSGRAAAFHRTCARAAKWGTSSWAVACRRPGLSLGPVGAENLRHQVILVNHSSSAVAPEDPVVIQVRDAIGQRSQGRGLRQGATGPGHARPRHPGQLCRTWARVDPAHPGHVRCRAESGTFGSQAPMGRAVHPDEITPGRADPAETNDRWPAAAAFSISGSPSS